MAGPWGHLLHFACLRPQYSSQNIRVLSGTCLIPGPVSGAGHSKDRTTQPRCWGHSVGELGTAGDAGARCRGDGNSVLGCWGHSARGPGAQFWGAGDTQLGMLEHSAGVMRRVSQGHCGHGAGMLGTLSQRCLGQSARGVGDTVPGCWGQSVVGAGNTLMVIAGGAGDSQQEALGI